MLIRRRHNNYLNWSFVALALAALMALAAAIALPAVTEAASPSLTISKTPTGKSVTSGEAKKIGSVKATGINAKRIRYSLQGPDGFSIKNKSGKISYDGSAIASDAESVLLIVTASDRKRKADDASVQITVAVTQPQPQPQPEVPPATEPPPAQEQQSSTNPWGTHPWSKVSCGSSPKFYKAGGDLWSIYSYSYSGNLRWELAYAWDWWEKCGQRPESAAARVAIKELFDRKGGDCYPVADERMHKNNGEPGNGRRGTGYIDQDGKWEWTTTPADSNYPNGYYLNKATGEKRGS